MHLHTVKIQNIKGAFVAVMILLSQLSLSILLPLASLAFFLAVRYYRPTIETLLSGLLLITLSVLYFSKLGSSNSIAFNIIASIFIYMLISACRPSWGFVSGFIYTFIFTAFIDVAFNLLSFFLGYDIFGRTIDFRPGDYLPRFGGLFGHAFISICLLIAAFFSCLLIKKRAWAIFFLAMLFCTGSVRGPIIGLFLIGMFVACNISTSRVWLTIVVASVLVIVAFAVVLLDVTSNEMRSLAWLSWIESIREHGLFGYSGFVSEDFDNDEGISISYLSSVGNFESTALNVFAHYGVVVFLLHIFAFSRIIFNAHRLHKISNLKTPLMLSYYIFFDFFLFNFTSFVPTLFLGFLLIWAFKNVKSRTIGV